MESSNLHCNRRQEFDLTESLISKAYYLVWIDLVMCRNSWEFYLFAGELLGNPLHLQSAVEQSQVGGLEQSLCKGRQNQS